MTQTRSVHVTLLVVLNSLAAAFIGLGAIAVLFTAMIVGTAGGAFMEAFFPGGGAMAAAGAAFIMMGALIMLAVAVFPLMTAIGLGKRRSWGRIMAFITAGFAALIALTSLTGFDVVSTLLWGGFAGYSIWALLQPDVVAEFQPTVAQAA